MSTSDQLPLTGITVTKGKFDVSPVKIFAAGKQVDKKTPYQIMKDRIDCAEKLVDEMTQKERIYRKAARESLRQLMALRCRLNECIRWVRNHVIDKQPIVVPDADPIVIADDEEMIGGVVEEEHDEICLPPGGLQKSPSFIVVKKEKVEEKPVSHDFEYLPPALKKACTHKEDAKNSNSLLFDDDEPAEQADSKKKTTEIEDVIAKISAMYDESCADCLLGDFYWEWRDDVDKVLLFVKMAHPDWEKMNKYFIESCEGWLHKKFDSLADFYVCMRMSFDKALQKKHEMQTQENYFDDLSEKFDGDEFCPPETQV